METRGRRASKHDTDAENAAEQAVEHHQRECRKSVDCAGGSYAAAVDDTSAAAAAKAADTAAVQQLLMDYTILLMQEGVLDGCADRAAAWDLVRRLAARLPTVAAADGPNSPPASGSFAAAAAAVEAQQLGSSNSGSEELCLNHSCRSTACGDLGCSLCRFNTVQPCGLSLSSRYLAEDPLKAPCGAPIHVKMAAAGSDGKAVETLLTSGTAVEVREHSGGCGGEVGGCRDWWSLCNPIQQITTIRLNTQ